MLFINDKLEVKGVLRKSVKKIYIQIWFSIKISLSIYFDLMSQIKTAWSTSLIINYIWCQYNDIESIIDIDISGIFKFLKYTASNVRLWIEEFRIVEIEEFRTNGRQYYPLIQGMQKSINAMIPFQRSCTE